MTTAQKKLTPEQIDNVLSDYLAQLKAEEERAAQLKAKKAT